jgi:hypothetical protein
MPAVLDDWPCAACGGQHTLCLDDPSEAWANRDFSYLCPATGGAVTIHLAFWDRVNAARPDGAVTLLPAGG